ncbi:MAG: D-alanyl-D-alanine carboxypeptidase/D-alanyl-D-alanine-endopeptidase [Phycisphaeraceae bacterium]|nr:D-alanyl-D-alanine carboxypeptidase/D-alanyl-D-alanine-endopeptidase [Phycisphaeraceae bacterium]
MNWRSVPAALTLCALALYSLPALGQPLQADVDRLIHGSKLGKSRVGVSILDVKTGEVLASQNSEDEFCPASNMKLLTTGAALWTLKPDFIFKTELRLDGDRLVVAGSGDPAFGDPEILQNASPRMTVSDMLDALTGSVTGAGVTKLSEIVVDDRVFDREFVHPTWPKDQLDRWYCAEVSGVIFHANVLDVYPRPGSGGQRPSVSIDPETSIVEVDVSKARNVSSGNNSVWLKRDANENRFQLMGDVRFAVTQPVRVTLTQNPAFFGQLLADKLERSGVSITGDAAPTPGGGGAARTVRVADAGEVLGGDRTIAVVTTPLADVVRRCNVESYNLYAEALIKRIGHDVTGQPGSWENGASVIRMLLSEKLGPDSAKSTIVRDGSGMSRDNRVSPATMTRWLAAIANDSVIASTFIHSLPKPGEGTLERRFKNRPKNELRAKSGYIRNVRSLSGYVIDDNGHAVAFSILANEVPAGEEDQAALQLHEQVVALIDGYLNKDEVGAKGGRDAKPARGGTTRPRH